MMKKTNEYKTIDLKMFPIDSDVSQYELTKKINEMAKEGWELVEQQVYDEWHILLTFKKPAFLISCAYGRNCTGHHCTLPPAATCN